MTDAIDRILAELTSLKEMAAKDGSQLLAYLIGMAIAGARDEKRRWKKSRAVDVEIRRSRADQHPGVLARSD